MLGRRMQSRVVPVRLDPLDVPDAHELHASNRLHADALEITLASVLELRFRGWSFELRERFAEKAQLRTALEVQLTPDTIEGLVETGGVEWLEEVVERPYLECA